MANLDTSDKRRSATGVFHMFTVPHIPGSHDVKDRRVNGLLLGVYSTYLTQK
jgi:hypothetical protein